jgi:EpsI family protein
MRREFWLSLVILAGGIFLLHHVSTADVPLDRVQFSRFPEEIAGSRAIDDPIPAPVLKELAATDYLSRFYVRPDGEAVNLFIGFYGSQRTGATYHSPKNCIPGSGWHVADADTTTLAVPGGKPVTVNEIVIQRGPVKQVVVYWYHDRGRVVASEYMAKIYLVWDAATRHRTDGSLVRVVVPVEGDEAAARTTARDFAQAVLPMLGPYLPG